MYDHHLSVFVKAAQLGSFSKAAQALFVTPSAVIQQINALEARLQAKLFQRSKQGIKMTQAGEYLYREAQQMIEHSDMVCRHLRLFNEKEADRPIITVGVGLLNRSQLLYPLWNAFIDAHPRYQLRIDNLTFTARKPDTVSEHIDLIEGLNFGGVWQNAWHMLTCCRVPLACAVPKAHPLAQKEIIRYEDLSGHTIVTYTRGGARVLDEFAKKAAAFGAYVIDVPQYDLSVFSECVVHGYLLQTPSCWHSLHPDLATRKSDWGLSLPYGLWSRTNAGDAVCRFIAFAAEHVQQVAARELELLS